MRDAFSCSDTDAELGFGKTQKFDASQRIESEIQFEIHGTSSGPISGFGLTHELCNHGARTFLETRMLRPRLRRRTAAVFRAVSCSLDLKPLQLARDRSRKRLVSNRKGKNSIVGRKLLRETLEIELDAVRDRRLTLTAKLFHIRNDDSV